MLINTQGTKLNTPPTIHFPSLEATGVTRFLGLVPKQFHVRAHVGIMYVLPSLVFQSVRRDCRLVNLVLPQCPLSWLFIVKAAAVVAQKVLYLHSGDPGSVPGLGSSPGEGNDYPVYGQRNLAGNSPPGRKELDTTE